jgi:hypothetical protein
MYGLSRSLTILFAAGLLALVTLGGCSPSASSTASEASSAATQERGGQDEFGPYEIVADWPQPLPDGPDGVKHDGWTWGSSGAI